MNKKILVIIVILVILGILLFPKVITLNDGGTKVYKALIYEVTRSHKIREGGYLVEGTIVKLFGKQIYCDIPKDIKIIEDGKEKNEQSTTFVKNVDGITLTLEIPKDWNYEELSRNTENDFYKYGLKIYKNSEDKYAVLYYYKEMFGVCGTGRTSEQINLNNGNKATIGYYDGKNTWEDISFNDYIAILNCGLNNEESNEFIKFIKTIDIKEINDGENTNDEDEITLSLKDGTLSNKGATFIIKNNSDKVYNYGQEYEIETKKDNKWCKIEIDGTLTWNSIAYILKEKGSSEINIDFSYGYGELSKGKYRLIKKVFKEEDVPINESKYKYLYAEFEIK